VPTERPRFYAFVDTRPRVVGGKAHGPIGHFGGGFPKCMMQRAQYRAEATLGDALFEALSPTSCVNADAIQSLGLHGCHRGRSPRAGDAPKDRSIAEMRDRLNAGRC